MQCESGGTKHVDHHGHATSIMNLFLKRGSETIKPNNRAAQYMLLAAQKPTYMYNLYLLGAFSVQSTVPCNQRSKGHCGCCGEGVVYGCNEQCTPSPSSGASAGPGKEMTVHSCPINIKLGGTVVVEAAVHDCMQTICVRMNL